MEFAIVGDLVRLSNGGLRKTDKHDLRRSVEQAREQLEALRVRLAASGFALASPEIASGIGSVEQTLAKLQAQCALIRDILEKADGVLTEHQDGFDASAADAGRLRALTLESLVTDEAERRTLANQLQAGLGQDLALAKMQIAALRDVAGAELHASLSGIERLVEEANRSFHAVSFRISPLILYDLGLVPALEWLAEDMRERFAFELRITDLGQVQPLGEILRVIVFRVVRELVIRAGGHGLTVLPVTLRCHGDEEQLRITIECGWSWLAGGDNGSERDVLFGLREQLGHVRATLHVESSSARATTATVTAPLTGPQL